MSLVNAFLPRGRDIARDSFVTCIGKSRNQAFAGRASAVALRQS